MVDDATKAFAEASSARFADFGIHPIDADVFDEHIEPRIAMLRRARRRRGEGERVGYMTLIDSDGVLRWELGLGPAPVRRLRSRKAWSPSGSAGTGDIVRQFKFDELPPNAVGVKLRQLDDYLTPNQGLREVTRRLTVGEEATPIKTGRILLIVHGTFSNCEHLLEEIGGTPRGRNLLGRTFGSKKYQQVLAFNHPTLSVSPILNAAALAQHFRSSGAEVDVICHSRGGLVVRWWLEVLDHVPKPRGRAVFAGPSLAGTGLAAPARLRGALNVLTNLSRTLGVIGKTSALVFPAAAPIGHAAGVLFGFFGKLTDIAARTPIVDAGVAMIPGLAGQSREGANGEILRLRQSFTRLEDSERRRRFVDNYYFLKSNFEPLDPTWKFWQYFRKDYLAHAAADVVFDGQNDLVVDTESMASLTDEIFDSSMAAGHIENFGGTSKVVHHLNYFLQPEAIKFIEGSLQLV
jgi:hypothetical protein